MLEFVRMALAFLLLAFSGAAAGQPLLLPPAPSALPAPPAEVRLIEGWQAADGSHVAAVEIRLAPGWHTYWRMPGEAGMPPVLDWSRSKNLASVRHEWPRRIAFESNGMQVIGYSGELVLPVVLTAERIGEPVEAVLDLVFGACKDICVPSEVRLQAELAPGRPARGKARIEAARADRPNTPEEAGVTAVTCGLDAAIAYTLIETAKLNGVEPHAWLADILALTPDYKITKLDDLLPWNWWT